jgi:hypothetical protein
MNRQSKNTQSESDPLVADGHRYDGFVVVENFDRNAGFSVLMTYALNGVRQALERNWLPVVNFDKSATRYFYDPSRGENIWEYHFEPVMGISFSELEQMLQEGRVPPSQVNHFSEKQQSQWHHFDLDRIATFWGAEEPGDVKAWMLEKRELGRRYVRDFIRVKPAIRSKAEEFVSREFNSPFTIGVHIRGTDFSYAEPTGTDDYFQGVDRLVTERSLNDFQIFLATDQEQFVEAFRDKYGPRLVTYDCARSSNEIAAFKFTDLSPYLKGEEVMIDILLLASCDYVFKCAASVGEYALWFNPEMEYTDFATKSSYDSRAYVNLEPAFSKLNTGGYGKLGRILNRVKIYVCNFLECRVYRLDARGHKPWFAALFMVRFLVLLPYYFVRWSKNRVIRLYRRKFGEQPPLQNR